MTPISSASSNMVQRTRRRTHADLLAQRRRVLDVPFRVSAAQTAGVRRFAHTNRTPPSHTRGSRRHYSSKCSRTTQVTRAPQTGTFPAGAGDHGFEHARWKPAPPSRATIRVWVPQSSSAAPPTSRPTFGQIPSAYAPEFHHCRAVTRIEYGHVTAKRWGITGAIIFALLAGMALPAAGADRSAEASPDEVETRIRRGVELRKSGDDRGALPEFQRAYELSHTPRAAAQLGLDEQALGRWDVAEAHLSEAMRATADPWVAKNRSTIQRALGVTKAHVGSIQIAGEPEGAEVLVNGRLVGQLPLNDAVRVIAGDVDVELRATGFHRSTQKIKVEPFQYLPLVIRLEKENDVLAATGKLQASRKSASSGAPETSAPFDVGRGPDPPLSVMPPPSPASSSQRSWATIAGWSLAGSGVAVAVAGLVEVLGGQGQMNDAVDLATRANGTSDLALYMQAARKFSDGNSQRTFGRVLLGIGGAVTLGGLVLVFTTRRSSETSAEGMLQPFVDEGSGHLVAGLRWNRQWR